MDGDFDIREIDTPSFAFQPELQMWVLTWRSLTRKEFLLASDSVFPTCPYMDEGKGVVVRVYDAGEPLPCEDQLSEENLRNECCHSLLQH